MTDRPTTIWPKRRCVVAHHFLDDRMTRDFARRFDPDRECLTTVSDADTPDDLANEQNVARFSHAMRARFLAESTVTIVILTKCAWSRRFIDWIIQASLHHGANRKPNGLLGILLPDCTIFPRRFAQNLPEKVSDQRSGYGGFILYPSSDDALWEAVNRAYLKRDTHLHLVQNPDERMKQNLPCY